MQGTENLWRSARQRENQARHWSTTETSLEARRRNSRSQSLSLPRAEFSSGQWELASQRRWKEKGASGWLPSCTGYNWRDPILSSSIWIFEEKPLWPRGGRGKGTRQTSITEGREGTVTCCLPWTPGSIPTWGCSHWAVSMQSLQHWAQTSLHSATSFSYSTFFFFFKTLPTTARHPECSPKTRSDRDTKNLSYSATVWKTRVSITFTKVNK